MTYLITGGAGFIGSMVCRKLVERGIDLVVLDNFSNGRKDFLPKNKSVRIAEIDIRDLVAVRRLIEEVKPHAVCHLAAIHFIPYCNANPQEAIETNVTGTLNVLEGCRSTVPEMVVVASTAAVYPIQNTPSRETDTAHPIDIYGISKLTVEHLAQLYVSQTGGRAISARIFNAIGPNETNPHLVPHLVDQLLRGSTKVALGNLDPYRDYIDTGDLAEGLILLMERRGSKYDVFNIGSGREHSVREIVQTCEKIIGKKIEVDQKAELIRKVERMHLCASIDKIKAETGWAPRIPLHKTLSDLLKGSSED